MKPLDSDEEEAEQLGAYQKELRRKLHAKSGVLTAKDRGVKLA